MPSIRMYKECKVAWERCNNDGTKSDRKSEIENRDRKRINTKITAQTKTRTGRIQEAAHRRDIQEQP